MPTPAWCSPLDSNQHYSGSKPDDSAVGLGEQNTDENAEYKPEDQPE